MITKEKIIEILHSHSYNVEDQAGNQLIVVDDDSWNEIAEQVKNCSIPDVSQRSELLKLEDKEMPFSAWLDKYFKPFATTELIYRQKNNNREFTERELIRMYKRAYQL